MTDFARSFAGSEAFMPHGMCYLWEPDLLWLHVISDGLTGLAYWAIPPALFVLVWKARDQIPEDAPYGRKRLPYEWVFLAFGLFIVACGTTHFMGVWTVWEPRYWLSGGVKAVTAVASVATAVALPPLIPRALKLIRDARDSDLRRKRLESANREMEELYGRLREADRLKSELVANVSHELRTPLTLILGPTDEMLRSEPDLPPEVQEGLRIVRRNARSLLGQVDDLLDASRLDLGRVEASLDDVDLAALVRETTAEFGPLARRAGIDLDVEAPGSLLVRADREKTERILLNLLSNAFKFTPDGGRVRVEVTTRLAPRVSEPVAPEEVVLSVRDSGEGVPREAREAIFERFRQAEGGSTRPHRGTGLGLAIAREYAEIQGGSIEVGDAPEGGARFTVRIPLRRSEGEVGSERPAASDRAVLERARLEAGVVAPNDGGTASAGPDEGADGSLGEGSEAAVVSDGAPRVLLVEDDPGLRKFLSSVLGRHYRVRTAEDGRDALEALGDEPPDLILTDIMMPRMDGEEFLEVLRERRELDGVPVVVLTAKADAELVSRLLRIGAQDYLLKPVGTEELLARLRNHLDVARSRKILQEELASREERLERLAGEAAQRKRRLESMVEEKSLLVRELHHRVKGNLQTVSSLLNLQVRRVQGGPARKALEESRGRISAMALLHEKLYQTDHPTETGMDDYLRSLVRDVFQSWGRQGGEVRSQVDAGGIRMEADRAVTCGLLVHELVTNSLRHGFPDERTGRIGVRMERIRDGGTIRLVVEDDGVGMPEEGQGEESDSLGLSLSRALVDQLGGSLDSTEGEDGSGVRWLVEFPERPVDSGRRREA